MKRTLATLAGLALVVGLAGPAHADAAGRARAGQPTYWFPPFYYG